VGEEHQPDLLLNAMESGSDDNFPRARFIDTEFAVSTKIVWDIGIVDADQMPLIIAIIDQKQDPRSGRLIHRNQACQVKGPRCGSNGTNLAYCWKIASASNLRNGART
jgi:hypothetical protein